jgi:hypothetical protein
MIPIPPNWVTFRLYAQYADAAGNVSDVCGRTTKERVYPNYSLVIVTFTSIDSLAFPLKIPRVGGTSA